MVDNHPGPRAQPKSKGVVIDHRFMATVLYLIYIPPDWLVH